MLKSMLQVTIGLLFVTDCLNAKPPVEPTQVLSIYANGLRNIEKDIYIAQILVRSGTELSLGKSENTVFEYDEQQIRNRLEEYEVAISYNDAIRPYIEFYMTMDHERLKLLFGLTEYYSESVSSSLRKNSLPLSLSLFPAVCSSYGPSSTNDHGGAGPWHLNYPQSIKYGLVINKYIDERREMKKASVAATAYLAHLYKSYNDWELALAAYTCGPATINKALASQKTTTFWSIYDVLPEELRDIVPAMAALTYVQEQRSQILSLAYQENSDTLRIHKRLLYKALNDLVQADVNELSFLNPGLNQKEFPANYTALLPNEVKKRFTKMKDSVYVYQSSVILYPKPKVAVMTSPDGAPITHTVKSGEVLGVIAERYKVRVSEIQYWNNMGGSTRINVGQRLVIYDMKKPIKTAAVEKKVEESNPFNSEYITYVVQRGECLDGIAQKFPGISTRNIRDINKIDDNIQTELILKIKKR